MNKPFVFALLLLGAAISPSVQAQISQSQKELLNDAEIRRGVRFSSGMQWTVKAGSKAATENANATMIVRTQAGKAAAEIVEPATSAGKKYLLTDGQMYFYRPGTKRAVLVPRRTQINGNAAIGDIASISFLQEYSPASARKATLNGESCTQFELVARPDTTASYDKVLLWVSNTDRVSRKAEFYTKTGKLIRTATFKHDSKITIKGQELPFLSRLEVLELLGEPKTTVLDFNDFKTKNFPPQTFEVDQLPVAS
ncbi:MAG: outer membrane lipoprotein-sorting protein [Verrucomicrobia bacterium]|nr:MAG: outer membrane lipoprotein-sorting protein [Verrucomicrobiota bacterium]